MIVMSAEALNAQTREKGYSVSQLSLSRIRRNEISALSIVCLYSLLAPLSVGWVEKITLGLFYFLAAVGIQFRLLCNMLKGMVAVEGQTNAKWSFVNGFLIALLIV